MRTFLATVFELRLIKDGFFKVRKPVEKRLLFHAIDYCTKIETRVSPKNLLVESSKNIFIF